MADSDNAKPSEQFVKLAEAGIGFFDDETKFQIAGDQVKPLGASTGRRTMLAIQSGGLLIVEAPKQKTEPEVILKKK